jgi:hypothetical protein
MSAANDRLGESPVEVMVPLPTSRRSGVFGSTVLADTIRTLTGPAMPSGAEILVRTMSAARVAPDASGHAWNYHSRSDHHSKVACWGIVFDLLGASALFRKHVEAGRVAFGINHEMRDFKTTGRKISIWLSASRRSDLRSASAHWRRWQITTVSS